MAFCSKSHTPQDHVFFLSCFSKKHHETASMSQKKSLSMATCSKLRSLWLKYDPRFLMSLARKLREEDYTDLSKTRLLQSMFLSFLLLYNLFIRHLTAYMSQKNQAKRLWSGLHSLWLKRITESLVFRALWINQLSTSKPGSAIMSKHLLLELMSFYLASL